MSFLVWYNPLTWAGDAFELMLGGARILLNSLLYFLSTFVYDLIISLYNAFDILSKSRILDAEILDSLASRIGLVLGIVMLFMVIISAIQMVLDPDKIEKNTGDIIKKVLLVVVMLGVSSFAFRALYGVQNILLESNAVSKLLLPYNVDTENFGGVLSSKLFGSFYYTNNDLYTMENGLPVSEYDDVVECYISTAKLQENIMNDKGFDEGITCLNLKTDDGESIIKFNGLLMLVFGLVAAYFLLSYCVSVGVRTVQLAFLEIISPMAIISYLSPKKDTMFEKWWKLYFATYIDVFIRIILINFVIFLIATIFENDRGWAFWKTVEENGGTSGDLFLTVLMVMALFTFAQKAPELIKKIFPASDSGIGLGFNSGAAGILGMGAALGINTAGKLASTVGRTGKALGWQKGAGFKENLNNLKNGLKNNKGAAAKALAAGTGGMLLGGAASLFRGGKTGFSSKNPMGAIKGAATEQSKANLTREQRIASGSTVRERAGDTVRGMLGLQSGYEGLNQELSMSNSIKETLGNDDIIKHIREVRQSYIQSCAAKGTTAEAEKLVAYDNAEKEALRQMYAFSHNNDNGSTFVHIEDTTIGLNMTEEYKTNRGIHNQIKNNEKRAGQTFATFDDVEVRVYDKKGQVVSTIKATADNWKADNNSLKTKIADKTKKGK